MTVFLWIAFALALLSALLITVSMMSGPSGPEGPVGAGVVVVFSCACVALLVVVFAARGMMGFLPGGRLVQFAAAVGVAIAFSVSFSASLINRLDRHRGVVRTLLVAVAYLLLAGCATVIYRANHSRPPALAWAMAILLGGAAVAGWGIGVRGMVRFVRKQQEELDQLAREQRERDEQRRREDMARYGELGDDAPLFKLLRFAYSRDDRIRQLARERIAGLPGRDEALRELLDLDSEDAVRYIATVSDTPPQDLGPAYASMLERQLESWISLQFDEHAGTWELNLREYFEGAQKIQRAGADLRRQLRSWHEFLLKCQGLGSLPAFVERLL